MDTNHLSNDIPPADLLPVGRRASLGFLLVRLLVTPILHALFRIRIEGRDNIPGDGPYVIAANHLGWLDSFLVLLAFPTEPRVHFLGAVRGLVARRVQWRLVQMIGGYLPVDTERRGDRRLFEHVERCLRLGGAIAVYPEACYGRPGELQPFRKGFAHFAAKASVPVVPVALWGTESLWLRRELRVIIGEPIVGNDVDELVAATRARLTPMLPRDADHRPRLRLMQGALTNLF
ncbi:MAG TPA: lysophospholipid acyltransferase family protein [Candidatus Dormibacteraeota bacterium]|jgi:1-acyl-sn-glycerol-3-phosphate acyltransferase